MEGMETASYTRLAEILTKRYDIWPPLDRRQVYAWDKRHTLNKAGVPFPHPVIIYANVPRTRPSREFNVREVMCWYRPGVPEQGNNQYEQHWKYGNQMAP
jgi:hypothetical protein